MRLSKSEQAILDAFTVQRQQYPGKRPQLHRPGEANDPGGRVVDETRPGSDRRTRANRDKSRGLIRASIAVKVAPPEEPSTEHAWVGLLRTAVKQSGRSDRELAKAVGLSQPTITRFRNNTRGLSFENAAKLASALGFSFVQ